MITDQLFQAQETHMESTLSPATLSGKTIKGVSIEQGVVVHVVRCNETQLKSGMARQVYSLCGRTHDKNDYWSLSHTAAVTCPKCRKKMTT
jgi:hypothetical protein